MNYTREFNDLYYPYVDCFFAVDRAAFGANLSYFLPSRLLVRCCFRPRGGVVRRFLRSGADEAAGQGQGGQGGVVPHVRRWRLDLRPLETAWHSRMGAPRSC